MPSHDEATEGLQSNSAPRSVRESPEPKFSEVMFAYHTAESDFEDALLEAGFGEFAGISGDHYDNSIEIHKVGNSARLNEAAQRVIFDAGFSIAFVNHQDGWETHYNWKHDEPFAVQRGWRRRYVQDPSATTTNVIAGSPSPGYYEINYWPEGWGDPKRSKDLESGYFRIVEEVVPEGQNEAR